MVVMIISAIEEWGCMPVQSIKISLVFLDERARLIRRGDVKNHDIYWRQLTCDMMEIECPVGQHTLSHDDWVHVGFYILPYKIWG